MSPNLKSEHPFLILTHLNYPHALSSMAATSLSPIISEQLHCCRSIRNTKRRHAHLPNDDVSQCSTRSGLVAPPHAMGSGLERACTPEDADAHHGDELPSCTLREKGQVKGKGAMC